MLLRDTLPSLAGLNAVVIGRSNLVGKPMAALLLRENCTVTHGAFAHQGPARTWSGRPTSSSPPSAGPA